MKKLTSGFWPPRKELMTLTYKENQNVLISPD